MQLLTQSQADRIKETDNRNNIENWMKQNLPASIYDQLQLKIPEIVGISEKTWFNYRKHRTPVPHTVLNKLLIIFAPWGVTLDDLLNNN